MTSERLIGVDVGASKIKGAVVDLGSGELVTDAVRLDTPRPATPTEMATQVAKVVDGLDADGTVGVALPCVVRSGLVRLAANLDQAWIGTDPVELLTNQIGRPVVVLNDADAAGLAEAAFGAARHTSGTVLVLTFGTGIGSALLHDRRLIPNTEFGHISLHGVAEELAAAKMLSRHKLPWTEWSKRVNRLLADLTMIIQPELIVIGGGVSRPGRVKHWRRLLRADAEVVPATLANRAGMVGAGTHASAASTRPIFNPATR